MMRVIQSGWLKAVLAGTMSIALVESTQADDWLRFRGPNGSGVSTDMEAAPVTWSATENLKWKVELPGPGSSSPIIVGDKVFVTCWSGYGVDRQNPGDQSELKRHLICFNRADGSVVWDRQVAAELPEEEYGGMFAEHGYASHTPVSDGQRIFAFFGKSGLVAFDLEGTELWRAAAGKESDPRGWGSASSPVLFGNLVIVSATAESEALIAFDQETGKEVWRQEAQGFSGTWGTPVLVKVDETRTDLVLGVPYEMWAFNPETGKLRWFCTAMDTNSYCSSVITDGSVIYGVEGRGGGSIAVRAGGSGDVTSTHVVWSGRDNNRIGTPLLQDGRIYFIASGVANCINSATGERVYQERLLAPAAAAAPTPAPTTPAQEGQPPAGGRQGRGGRGGGGGMGGQDYSSPVAADGKLYYVTRTGDMYVVKLGETFEQLAVNRVTPDRDDFSGSPAIADGELYVRSSKHLYCIANQ